MRTKSNEGTQRVTCIRSGDVNRVAQTQDILRLMIGQGLGLTVGTVVLGVGGALALTPLMRTLPSQVSGTDAATFAAMKALLLVVALGATGTASVGKWLRTG